MGKNRLGSAIVRKTIAALKWLSNLEAIEPRGYPIKPNRIHPGCMLRMMVSRLRL